MTRMILLVMVTVWPLLKATVGRQQSDRPGRVTTVESVRRIETGAILAEDFDGPGPEPSRWRVWQQDPDRTSVHQEGGRLVLDAKGPVGHNGLWETATAKYKDVILVGEMDIRSRGSMPHRLALHLCGGDGARSPDHWVEIDLIDLGEKARLSPMAALPLGFERHQDQFLELPHPPGHGFLCRLTLNGDSNLVTLDVQTDAGWSAISPPIPLPLRTIHAEVKLHGWHEAPGSEENVATESQGWFDNIRIYPRPQNHHVGVRLVRADGSAIWYRENDGWPPKILDKQGKARSIEDLEVQLWTTDGKTMVAAARSANMGFYLLPLKNAPWDVYPVAAELRVLLDGQVLGSPLQIESQGVYGLYPDDVYDVVIPEP